MARRPWFLSYPAIWYQTLRLKQRRKIQSWSHVRYYREMYALASLSHGNEGDKFSGLRDRITSEVRGDKARCRILDIATGRGYQAANLWAHGYRQVYACDVVPERVAQARHLHAATGIRFFVGAAERLGFPRHSFDAVVISAALHDLTLDEVRAALEECARILIPGGRMIVLEPRFIQHIPWLPVRVVYPLVADLTDESLEIRDFVNFDLASHSGQRGFAMLRLQAVWLGLLSLYTFQKLHA
jgi:SAM-dependent methyltransferase